MSQQYPPPGNQGYPPAPNQGQYPPPQQNYGQPPQGPNQPPPQQGYGQYPPQNYGQQQDYTGAGHQQPYHPPPQGQAYGQGYAPPPGQQPQGYPPAHDASRGYAPPPQGQQNQGYQPPPGGYPPPSQGYPPPQGHPPPQGYPPPQGHNPQNYQQPGQPPQGYQQYGQPQQGYQPPGAPGYAPPQGQPPQGYPQPGFNQNAALPGQYGAPAQPQWGANQGMPTPASLGYTAGQMAPQPMTQEVDNLWNSMHKGFGTDEKLLSSTLAKLDPLQIAKVKQEYPLHRSNKTKRPLLEDIKSDTSGDFRTTLLALARGPLGHDVDVLHDAMHRPGTKESVLDDVLANRSNADVRAIKDAYHKYHHVTLEKDLRDDLSGATEQMFMYLISENRAEDYVPADPRQTDDDAKALQNAVKDGAKNQTQFCSTLLLKNNAQVRAIAQSFQRQYSVTLLTFIKKEFSGHMEDTLMLFVERALDPIESDVVRIEETMKGLNTNETKLLNRVVRAHWNPQHMRAVNDRYRQMNKKTLKERIESKTSGDFKRALAFCVG